LSVTINTGICQISAKLKACVVNSNASVAHPGATTILGDSSVELFNKNFKLGGSSC